MDQVLKNIMDWKSLFNKYEDFLRNIPLIKYSELREIKTVEQNLPKNINPLKLLYRIYWVEKIP